MDTSSLEVVEGKGALLVSETGEGLHPGQELVQLHRLHDGEGNYLGIDRQVA